jgi:hypothetical protein
MTFLFDWVSLLFMGFAFIISSHWTFERLKRPTEQQLYIPNFVKSGTTTAKLPIFLLRKAKMLCPFDYTRPPLSCFLSCLSSVCVAYLTPVSGECASCLTLPVCHKPRGPDAVLSTLAGPPTAHAHRRPSAQIDGLASLLRLK